MIPVLIPNILFCVHISFVEAIFLGVITDRELWYFLEKSTAVHTHSQ